MGFRVSTNVQSRIAQRAFMHNRAEVDHSRETLASGNRINTAGDDIAALSISSQLYANIRSGKQAIRNTLDGVSLTQVAEGALNEISNLLVRFRELSIQAASDTVGHEERHYLNKEMQTLKLQVDQISEMTEFNGVKILKENIDDLELQIGIHNDPFTDQALFKTDRVTSGTHALGMFDISVSDKESARGNLSKIDSAIVQLNNNRAVIGAFQNLLYSQINNMLISNENLSAAKSRIQDTDYAMEGANLVRHDLLVQSNLAMISQANVAPQLALSLLK